MNFNLNNIHILQNWIINNNKKLLEKADLRSIINIKILKSYKSNWYEIMNNLRLKINEK